MFNSNFWWSANHSWACFYSVFLVIEIPSNPCNPSPCGSNAICREQNGAGSCTCLDEYFGDPYVGCRPECLVNSECPHDRACMNKKCRDPCPGSCGINAICQVINHIPECSCLPGFAGDALSFCKEIVEICKMSNTENPGFKFEADPLSLLCRSRRRVLNSTVPSPQFIQSLTKIRLQIWNQLHFTNFFACLRSYSRRTEKPMFALTLRS